MQLVQQLLHGPLTGRIHQIGCNLGQWNQDKSAGSEPRVRNVQVELVKDIVAEEEQVQVQRARPIGNACAAVAPELTLDPEQAFQQAARAEFGFEGHNGVHEAGLVGVSHGFGGVDRRAADNAAQGPQAFCRCFKRGVGRPEGCGHVPAHANVGNLHPNRLSREPRERSAAYLAIHIQPDTANNPTTRAGMSPAARGACLKIQPASTNAAPSGFLLASDFGELSRMDALNSSLGARRNEDIALDLLKFVAGVTNAGRPAASSTGFIASAGNKPEDHVNELLSLYGRCLKAVEGKGA